jgi:TPR repeat protein
MSFFSRVLQAVTPKKFRSTPPNNQHPESLLNTVQQDGLNKAFTEAFGKADTPQVAFDACKTYADQGSTQALYQLGIYYEKGDGNNVYPQQAAEVYWRAATHHHIEAQFNLALLYAQGSLGDIDLVSAHHWFEQAAQAGLKEAQFNLAHYYQEGFGCVVDLKKSFELYQQAADQGYVSAWQNLAVMHYQGEGTVENKIEAYAWTLLAAKSNNAEALAAEPTMTQDLTADEIVKGKQRLEVIEQTISQQTG